MPRDCWIGWDSVLRTRVFSDRLVVWFQREHCEALLSVAIMGQLRSMVKSEAENVMEAEI
jgi:hypothetical protein